MIELLSKHLTGYLDRLTILGVFHRNGLLDKLAVGIIAKYLEIYSEQSMMRLFGLDLIYLL